MKRSVILGFAVGPIGAAALSFISLPIMAWIFPPQSIGMLSMLQVAISFSVVLCCLGLDQAYVREYHETDDRPGLLLSTTVPGLVIMLIILIALMSFDPALISHLLFGVSAWRLSLLAAACLIVAYLTMFLSLVLRMQDRGLAYSMSQLLSKFLLLAIVVGYAFFLVSREFIWLLIAQLCALMIALAVFAWNTRCDWIPAIRARVEREQLARLLNFGWPLIFGGIASWGLAAMDRVFLRSMSTFDELAVYSVAASIASGVTIIAGIFNTIWAPMVYKWVADNADLKRVDRVASQMTTVILLLVCLGGGSSWVLRYLLPSTYALVPYLVVGCMVAPLLYTLSEVTGIGIAVSRRTTLSMFASFSAVALNVALCYVLVPRSGARGAMIATACAFCLYFLMRTEFSARVWRRMPRAKQYVYVGGALLIAILYATAGPRFPMYSVVAWWVLLVAVACLDREQLLGLWETALGSAKRAA